MTARKPKRPTPAQRAAARDAVERAILRCCRAAVRQGVTSERFASALKGTIGYGSKYAQWLASTKATERAGAALRRAQVALAAVAPRSDGR